MTCQRGGGADGPAAGETGRPAAGGTGKPATGGTGRPAAAHLGRRQFLATGVGGLAALGAGAGGRRLRNAPARLGGTSAPSPVNAPATWGSAAAAAPFGFSSSGGYFIVSTGAGLTFKIRQSNGDMTSLNFGGTELQDQSSFSQVESGLGTGAAVSAYQTGNYVVVTESVNNWYGSGTLHHYLVAVSGQNNIYMATYVDSAGGGELRWITRLNRAVINTLYTPADVLGGTAIESTDIDLVGGQTRSKYYSNRQAMNLTVRGVTGSGIGVYMAYGNRESSAGGPFFRDIEQQGTSNVQLYNYLWSAHNQTEPQRLGVLYGPYALMVAGTSTPTAPDMSFMYNFGFAGSVAQPGRGFVVGKAMGVQSGAPVVVGFANSSAQYWCVPESDGNFSSPMMKPGSYVQTLYQNELAVATRTVTITAGGETTGQNITSGWTTPSSPIFRIGDWTGSPVNFRNWPNLTWMHPSDTRMTNWGPVTFTVASSPAGAFPAYQWKDVNNPTRVVFSLDPGQIAARTVRIGITAAYAGGRPQITVNSWTSPAPSPSSQPSSRSLTIGTYRGNNTLFVYNVPASAFTTGTNTMTINVISGSSGSGYLSPGVSYDCVEMY
jgi:rhamnogalacturonan endolyase